MKQYIVGLVRTFSARERLVFFVAVAVAIISGLFVGLYALQRATFVVPDVGGSYSEGVVGQPSFVNPILAKDGTPDKDLVALTFANIPSIAQSIKYSDDFKVWTVRIKDDAVWHDESSITSDDILFTVQMIKNPDTLSPLFADWQNITATRVSEREVRFELLNSYALFENILRELYPVPKKLFADLSPSTLKLSSYNLEPVGSGPFMFDGLSRRKDGFVEEYTFKAFEKYSAIGKAPYMKKFSIKFFENEERLVRAYNLGIIDGFGTYNPALLDGLKIHFTVRDVPSTKYYAAFFNAHAYVPLASRQTRQALSLAVDKSAIINIVMAGRGSVLNGPVPSSLHVYDAEVESYYSFDRQKARELLGSAGWEWNQETNEWTQGTSVLRLSLTVPDLFPLREIAGQLKVYWEALGIPTSVSVLDPSVVSGEIIRTRNYEVLVFGNILSREPDPYSFWHSSERFYPGLNLSLYENASVDSAIIALRSAQVGSARRAQLFSIVQDDVAADYPALFIASSRYLYVTKGNIPGIAIHDIALPHQRFDNVTEWYLKTRRVFSRPTLQEQEETSSLPTDAPTGQ